MRSRLGGPFPDLILSVLVSIGLASALAARTPDGWVLAGSHPQYYDAGVTTATRQEGKTSAYLASRVPQPEGFGTLMQMFAADSYRGKRLRMSGSVRADAVDGWAGLWMRVDGPQRETLQFDNMQDRPITGTRDWLRYEIVLDIPQQSTQIAFGVLLHGKGQLNLDAVRFEEVDTTVPVTDLTQSRRRSGPVNLGFEN